MAAFNERATVVDVRDKDQVSLDDLREIVSALMHELDMEVLVETDIRGRRTYSIRRTF